VHNGGKKLTTAGIMRYLNISFLSAAVIVSCFLNQARAQETSEKPPNLSFGIAGSYGYYSGWVRNKGSEDLHYSPAPGYGGGVVVEKMFNNILGVQSGLWFNRFSIDLKMRQKPDPFSINSITGLIPIKLSINAWSLSVPLSLITSLNASIFSFNILAGIKYTEIVESRVRIDNPLLSYKKNFDLVPYLNHPQFGFTLGFNFKFRITEFVDLFFGGMGELYVTELIRGNSDITSLYAISALSGVMFRTNVFPMKE
jgi:hypothetical protein